MRYYFELPTNFKKVKEHDKKESKEMINLIFISLLFGLASFISLCLIKQIDIISILSTLLSTKYTLYLLCAGGFILLVVLYVILHYFIHGLMQKILTGHTPSFNASLSSFYCGNPSLYLSKITYVTISVFPFILFSIIFIGLMIFIKNEILLILLIALFSFHNGLCFNDLYFSSIAMFKFMKYDVLINDKEEKLTFFIHR